ncbi:hypothetical protein HMPREF0378_1746 [Eubacterium nodatum ATCC 33099]|nr:hypothetical protein HMPREF0378_1746 [Eubacterium nodatum ATCC 33099]
MQEIIDKGNYEGIMPIRSWGKSTEIPQKYGRKCFADAGKYVKFVNL